MGWGEVGLVPDVFHFISFHFCFVQNVSSIIQRRSLYSMIQSGSVQCKFGSTMFRVISAARRPAPNLISRRRPQTPPRPTDRSSPASIRSAAAAAAAAKMALRNCETFIRLGLSRMARQSHRRKLIMANGRLSS